MRLTHLFRYVRMHGLYACMYVCMAECTLCDICMCMCMHVIQVDITDEDKKEWWDKYKYDIPVLHVNGDYWIKHRTTPVCHM